jgi:cell wall-associated NlpC family hydrolase
VSSFENNSNVQWHSPSGYTPQPGDAVIWADSSGAVQHVGIVTGYGGSLSSEYSVNGNWQDFYSQGQVIWDQEAHNINGGREGNYSDADINSYNDWHIAGYATPE